MSAPYGLLSARLLVLLGGWRPALPARERGGAYARDSSGVNRTRFALARVVLGRPLPRDGKSRQTCVDLRLRRHLPCSVFMINETVRHYRILEKLGVGGGRAFLHFP